MYINREWLYFLNVTCGKQLIDGERKLILKRLKLSIGGHYLFKPKKKLALKLKPRIMVRGYQFIFLNLLDNNCNGCNIQWM